MLNEYYPECRTLPTINKTFPQFSRPISLLSPLDLSLRAVGNIIPITPPTTPSPPRKRQRLMSDENYLWRPHAMETLPLPLPPPPLPPPLLIESTAATTPTTTTTTITTSTSTTTTTTTSNKTSNTSTSTNVTSNENYLNTLTNFNCPHEGVQPQDIAPNDAAIYNNNNKNNLHKENQDSFEEIPESQRSVHGHHQHSNSHSPQQTMKTQSQQVLDTIYVDDETIVLTEDENETLVSSQDLSGYGEDLDEDMDDVLIDNVDGNREAGELGGVCKVNEVRSKRQASENNDGMNDDDDDDGGDGEDEDDEEEDEYVDILSNDDDDLNPLRLQQRQIIEAELAMEHSSAVLTRNKLVYDNEELHNQAVNGLAKLFERDFGQLPSKDSVEKGDLEQFESCKTYTILETGGLTTVDLESKQATTPPPVNIRPHKPHKAERKRMKMRKFLGLDEETISPVSGTIIRKLRDDEELVVRKGDIDPAFNVVEITEEAKAILASIDNKIGAYLCQLCRTLYDDAFMLAQHRCPRIVHIEYKCSECEKVFNCPANLASHRRWHKPKSELLANKQSKRPHGQISTSQSETMSHEKQPSNDDCADGIFPCNQCGKTFRRHAYLKKHQASHQMLENLKSLDIFKNHNNSGTAFSFPHSQHHTHHPHQTQQSHQHHTHHYTTPTGIFNANQRHYPSHYPPGTSLLHHQHQNLSHHKPTTGNHHTSLQRLPPSAFSFPPLDQRHFYTLGELYLSQQLERSSAFQYVQQANHLRNLTTAVGNLLPAPVPPTLATRPLMHTNLMSLPVK